MLTLVVCVCVFHCQAGKRMQYAARMASYAVKAIDAALAAQEENASAALEKLTKTTTKVTKALQENIQQCMVSMRAGTNEWGVRH